MKRREFITVLGGSAVAWPLSARAQQPTMPVIGFLQSGSLAATAHTRVAFHSGLREGGYVEGHRLPSLAADLISNDVVGGNLTGVAFFAALLGAKQFGLLRELVPNAVTIGMLVNPNFPDAPTTVADGQAAARAEGLELQVFHTSNEGELVAAFADMRKRRIDAVVVVADIFFDSRRHQVVALASRHTIPAIYPWRDYVMAGGLMSYGTSLTDGYRQAGNYVARILRGAQPSDLPVVRPTKFELVINLKAAKALALTVPPSLQVAADEVIE